MWERLDNFSERPKLALAEEIEGKLVGLGFDVVERNLVKEWGAYFRIDQNQGKEFLKMFFNDIPLPPWAEGLRFDPKILLVAPEKRLSWQYHDRRGEFWRVVKGPVDVYLSPIDEMPDQADTYYDGHVIEIAQGVRHRLAGTDGWGIVAEIWISTDPAWPSDEEDNYRLEDDFGRS